VICVTHLPQVAAFADSHHRVEKRVRGGRTATSVASLEGAAERRAEVARMLAGVTVTASALDHADALIAAAREARLPARGRRPSAARASAARVVRGAETGV
jgi:DNA repair protein RecN (Recombination protein N)